MNILITFENMQVAIHAIDLIRTLQASGHTIYYHCVGQKVTHYEYLSGIYSSKMIVLPHLPDLNKIDVWMYDLTPGDENASVRTPFLDQMSGFKGNLVCINYEDGYDFFLVRSSDYLIDKTDVFLNNALYKDRERYDSRIRNKLVLSTSYITNSQLFKKIKTAFESKQARAFFTGNITGFSMTHLEERKCRALVPLSIIQSDIPCFYRIYHYDPSMKDIYDYDVPQEYKQPVLPVKKYIEEFSGSKYILSLRGMGLTVNRFFEGLASNALVFSTRFDDTVDFIGQGAENTHYINIDWSGSDVVEKIKYYIEHEDEAAQIAGNGRHLWEEFSMLDNKGLLPIKVREDIVQQIYKISGMRF